MSISDNYAPINQQADGSTVDFSGNWAMLNADYFLGFKELISTGVRTPLVIGTDGSLAFDNSGFTFTFFTPLTNLYNVIIGRAIALDQTTPYRTSRGFQGQTNENSFDKITAIAQDLRDDVNRSLKFPLGSDTITDASLPLPQDGYGIVWDGVAGAMRNTTAPLDILEGAAVIVAANIVAVNTVASNIAAVITSNANATNINTVAANISNVNIVAGISPNVTTVAGISGNVTTVAGISANITTVAGISAAVTTVAGISSAVSNVASNSTNVTTVATNITAVNTAATNIAAIQAAPGAAALVASAVHKWTFDSSTTSSDPGTGKIRYDNATVASVANLIISNLTGDTGNPDLTTFIQTWDDSTNTNKGTITIAKADGSNAIFTVSGAIVNHTTWSTIPVTYVSNGGAISNTDALGIGFARSGDKGANGAGSGDFIGPASSTANTPVVFADTTGKLGKMANANIGLPVAQNELQASDVASASTANIGAALGNYMRITGSTTITAFDTVQAGTEREVTFTGALTLTHNSISLVLPGAANITTAAGDNARFRSLGSGNWRCMEYNKADGTAVVGGSGASLSANQTFTGVNTFNNAAGITLTNSGGGLIKTYYTASGPYEWDIWNNGNLQFQDVTNGKTPLRLVRGSDAYIQIGQGSSAFAYVGGINAQLYQYKNSSGSQANYEWEQFDGVTTTNATATQIGILGGFGTDDVIAVEVDVQARRTGGASGTAGDSAAYVLRGVFKMVAGTLTQISTTTQTILGESQAAWDATLVVSGSSIQIKGTGAASNNITWWAHTRYHANQS